MGSPCLSNTFREEKIRSLNDLKGITLIETQRRLISWQTILVDFSWIKTQRIIFVSYSMHAFKVAEIGLGVALRNLYNTERYINEERLCIPFDLEPEKLPPEPRYFLSVLPQKAHLPKIVAFSK